MSNPSTTGRSQRPVMARRSLLRSLLLRTLLVAIVPIAAVIFTIILLNGPASLSDFATTQNIIAIGIGVGVSAIVTIIFYRPIIQSLSDITYKATLLARGETSASPVNVTRSDELGLLGESLNLLSEKTHQRVQNLTTNAANLAIQLKTFVEVTHLSAGGFAQEEVFQKVLDLIITRFPCNLASLYIMDDTNGDAVLSFFSESQNSGILIQGTRVPALSQTPIGSVIQSKTDFTKTGINPKEDYYTPGTILPETISQLVLPILVGQRLMGILDIQSTVEDYFSTETISFYKSLSVNIANTVQSVLTTSTEPLQFQDTSRVEQTIRGISDSGEENDVVRLVRQAIAQSEQPMFLFSFQKDNIRLLDLFDPQGTGFDVTLKGLRIQPLKDTEELLGKRLVMLDDLHNPNTPVYDPIVTFLSRRDCRSAALIPVVAQNKVRYLLAVGSRDITPLVNSQVQPYARMMQSASAALDRILVLKTLNQQVKELQTLGNIGKSISVETDLYRLYDLLHTEVIRILGENLGFMIAVLDEESKTVKIPFAYEGEDLVSVEPFTLGDGLVSHVIQNRLPLLLVKDTDFQAQQLSQKITGVVAKSWLGVPLQVGGRTVGAMIVQDSEKEERFTEQDLFLFQTIAPTVAIAIQNTQLTSEMQAAVRDYEQEKFLLDAWLDSSPDLITFKDEDGKLIRVSQSYLSAKGITDLDELFGRTESDVIGTESGEPEELSDTKVLEGRKPVFDIHHELKLNDQTTIWASTSKIPILDTANRPAGLMTITHDISNLKVSEDLAQQRTEQLLTTAEIARESAGTLQVEEVLRKAVTLIRERFGFYHAAIFIIDQSGENAVLRESTSQAGEKMREAGHKLAVGSQSLVGQATSTGVQVIVNDVHSNPNYYPNPMLPDTMAEAAIPLKVGDRILGALDVQSDQIDAFSEESRNILQLLSDQLAIALSNATYFTQTQDYITKQRLLYEITSSAATGTTVKESLSSVARSITQALPGELVSVYLLDQNDPTTLRVITHAGYPLSLDLENVEAKVGEGIIGTVAETRKAIRVADTLTELRYIPILASVRSELAVPILFGDNLLGVLNMENENPNAYDPNTQDILSTLGTSLGAVISNVQLVTRIRQQVLRQQQLFEITDKIRRSVDMTSIIQTSAREIANAMGSRRAQIEIKVTQEPPLPTPAPAPKRTRKAAGNTGIETKPGDTL
ncbi:MAG TPA: GAF domain-containing protein [Longilinea sp.]|nr:GAF domain-containing protein [Longilinea sp.]